jgi:ABC-type dipeptide/oligopeptide/nickel transport system permease component
MKSLSTMFIALIFAFLLINLYSVGNAFDIRNSIFNYKWDAFNGKYSAPIAAGMMLKAFPRSLMLVLLSLILAAITGILLGMLFSYRGGRGKKTLQVFSLTIPISIPDVMVILGLQILMILLKEAGLPYIPSVGYKKLSNMILPVISLSVIPACYIARMTYALAVDTYGEKFILTSRAKGCTETRIHMVHIWESIAPSALDSLYSVVPIIISNLLVVEILFFYPGLAYSLFQSLDRLDVNVFMAMSIGISCVYTLAVSFIFILKWLYIRTKRRILK